MIPLKIETLLEGRVVEHDRVEYKTGWNPNDIIHSICAFANDYDNTNGGYIVIGVKEKKWYANVSVSRCSERESGFHTAGNISVLQYDCSKVYSKNGSG